MYSRYSGISIPQNYGGSRFSHLAEVETKTHRASAPMSPIKSSYVPIEEENEDEVEIEDFEEGNEEIIEEESEIEDENPIERQKADAYSSLKALFSSIEKDELILLGLILLLISDSSSQSNSDIIMILALLLVGGK